jgi:hypothetical protein
VTPHEFLGVLDDAITRTPKRPRNRVALELTVPVVRIYGAEFPGHFLGQDAENGGALYGYTRRQCAEMYAAIRAVAVDDARSADG